ncbi:MAG: oxidoreductase, partial [Rhodospirillaceae bacterium]|nr:oxidoreductase [Rhodospirillaceae bacterium]
MNTRQLYFVKPHQVEIRERQLPSLEPDDVLVKNLYSGISAGTEMLVYRGQLPDDMALDESLAAFEKQRINYPLQYGYACVG